ncbi:methyltransferase domain-containing protein [Methanobrevibacter curvatus]|uniref:Arsenite S-adenosylmethyltransferase n=1 Tax=Methanobrevibacter curvatus TaxID=49547 RepID=A0A166CHZ9_9EURY|nr:methyltransferase domain-containing protein [Methanobrevibacter curvatus]KZX14547.1 arsenite S-adenosylmethyltransferase [Methanobrevibacter curvatus]
MIDIAYDIKLYRKELLKNINEGSTVIELGSHIGNTTKLIAEKIGKNGKIFPIDNSPEAVAPMDELMDEFKNINFISGDVRLHNIVEKLYRKIKNCDILSIDLGGGYHPDTVFKVYYIYSSTFKPKYTIIRNRGLIDFVNSSKTFEEISSNNGWIESQRNSGIPPQIKEFNLWTDALKDND